MSNIPKQRPLHCTLNSCTALRARTGTFRTQGGHLTPLEAVSKGWATGEGPGVQADTSLMTAGEAAEVQRDRELSNGLVVRNILFPCVGSNK